MGGRGAWAQRNKLGRGDAAKVLNTAGGGKDEIVFKNPAIGASGSGLADVGDLSKIEVVSMTWKGSTHSPASNNNGKLVIRDAKGNLHESTFSSAGSARITYEFKDFVLKFEGFHSNSNQGQNAKEVKAYNSLPKAGKRYVPAPLTGNKTVNIMYNGRVKEGNMIALERATPLARKLTDREYRSVRKVFKVFERNKGNFITDLRLPGIDNKTGVGHNVFIVTGKNGRPSFKAVDIPYYLRGRRS